MGKRALGILLPILLVVLNPTVAGAEIYQWIDASGKVHFTQDLGRVPVQHRNKSEARAKSPADKSRLQTFSGPPPAAIPKASPMPSTTTAGEVYRIRVSRAGTGMVVDVTLNNNVTAPFLIDTGASDVLIPQRVVDRLGLHVGPETRTKRYSTANGVITSPVVMLRSVALGGATVENVPASISSGMQLGLLGLSYFNHFTYNIDAAQGIVTLRPNNLAENGAIRGGRSEAQWSAEYRNLNRRIQRIDAEKQRAPSSHGRKHRRLAKNRSELLRQRSLLDAEADQARVPMTWR